MQLRPVSSLEVFDLQHTQLKKTKKTVLSLRLDGETVTDISLYGRLSPASGEQTVAAFSDDEKPTLLAWIDPQSGQCHHVWHSKPAHAAVALLLTVLCIFLLTRWESFATWLQITLGCIMFVGAGWFLMGREFQQKKIEKALRSLRKQTYGSLGKSSPAAESASEPQNDPAHSTSTPSGVPSMKYISTRGGMPPKAFCEILLGGLAPDGGLTIAEKYPRFSQAELSEMAKLNYRDLAFKVISVFVDDIPAADLKALIDKTYTADVYCNGRADSRLEDITPVRELEAGLYIQELSNGPTLAFKDMAMQLLGNLFEYVLAREGREINIVGATSGDTGSAAEYAMRGKHGVNVFMLSPHGKMSPFQRAQMMSLMDANIYNLAITSMFDDCQDIVKAINNDAEFKQQYKVGAVNSINWGRVVAQVVYYFKGYFAVAKEVGEPVDFVVPSGNFGNVCAGHIAKQMGLPIRRLVVATNENDVLDEFFKSGSYRPRGLDQTFETSSPSMDITKASNLERFVFDLVGRDADKLAALWQQVDKGPGFQLEAETTRRMHEEFGFSSTKSTHADRLANIREVFERYGVMIDPHTADGYKGAKEVREAGVPLVILETALPIKFEATVREALGRDPERPASFVGLEDKPQRSDVLAADAEAIKAYIRQKLD